jgi:hypothetical protein
VVKGSESLAEIGDEKHRSSELTVRQGSKQRCLQIRRLSRFSGDPEVDVRSRVKCSDDLLKAWRREAHGGERRRRWLSAPFIEAGREKRRV